MQEANENLERLLRGNLKAACEIYLKYDEVVGEDVEESAEMDQARIERLLKSTHTILSSQAQIARLKGENFNVFRLLGLEEYEVKLHSPFITELLNPKGSHDQGSVFLEMFLQQVNLLKNNKVKASNAIVCTERYIGRKNINGENSTGGQIDIFITDGTRHISIENKINSGEQDDYQTTRYCNFEPCKNFVLFLTLEGDEANTTKTNYKPISYRFHIIPWLENCHRYCIDLPVLRETIKQYIHTIKNLTEGLIMQRENEDLERLLRGNLKAAREIYLKYKTVIDKALKEFVKKLEKKIREDPMSDNWEIKNTIENSSSINWEGLEIGNDRWPEIGKIKWQYWYENRKQHYCNASLKYEYGFLAPREFRNEIQEEMGERVNELEFLPSNKYWAFLKQDATNDLKKLFDNQEQGDLVERVAFELIDFIKACDSKLGGSDASQPS